MQTQTIPLTRGRRVSQTSPDTIVVGATLDAAHSRRFARAVARVARRRPQHVLVDMSATRSVDSSGFGTLISGLKKLADAGATPLVVCQNPTVRRLMDFAGVSRMFTVIDRLSEARRTLAGLRAAPLAS